MRSMRFVATLTITIMLAAGPLAAQTPARDPSARLSEVLPADVAARVLAKIAEARARDLPAAALEQRALKFAARGVNPADIEKSVSEHADRMQNAKEALETARGRKADADELEAGAEAIRKGVAIADLSELAKSASSGRSLAVPLFVLGSLLDRGLPSDQAIQRVRDRLTARAADPEFQKMAAELPPQAAAGQAHKPALTGPDLAATKRPSAAVGRGAAGGAPGIVPGNAGKNTRPTPKKPATPPGRSGRGGL